MYCFFDGAVACDIPLPGLPESLKFTADVVITLQGRGMDASLFRHVHSWTEHEGRLALSCSLRVGETGMASYLLRFPSQADFVISTNTISCHPHLGCSDVALASLLVDQVLPRWWAHQGHLVLHASAVSLPGGRLVAFLGESGSGKSTIAAMMVEHGAKLLSDDCVLLKVSEAGVLAIPSYTGLRLYADSITALQTGGADWVELPHQAEKKRLRFPESKMYETGHLETLYVLDAPGTHPSLSLEPLSGGDLIAGIIKGSFLMDPRDKGMSSLQFREAGGVASALPGAYSLAYPRNYHQLDSLYAAVLG